MAPAEAKTKHESTLVQTIYAARYVFDLVMYHQRHLIQTSPDVSYKAGGFTREHRPWRLWVCENIWENNARRADVRYRGCGCAKTYGETMPAERMSDIGADVCLI